MSTATAKRPANPVNLDNLTLSRKEGWRDYVTAPKRTKPEALSRAQFAVSTTPQLISITNGAPTGTTTLDRCGRRS